MNKNREGLLHRGPPPISSTAHVSLCPASQSHSNPSKTSSWQSPVRPAPAFHIEAASCWHPPNPTHALAPSGLLPLTPPSSLPSAPSQGKFTASATPAPGASLFTPDTHLGPGGQLGTVSSRCPLSWNTLPTQAPLPPGPDPEKVPHLHRRAWSTETTS